MFSGRLKGVTTGNFLKGAQFCESTLGPSCLSTAMVDCLKCYCDEKKSRKDLNILSTESHFFKNIEDQQKLKYN